MRTNTAEIVNQAVTSTKRCGETSQDTEIVKKKYFSFFGTEFVYLYLLGIVTAFCGWSVENIARLISLGILDCRYQLLPFISVYALIPFAFKILLGDPDDITFFGKRVFKKRTRNTKICSNIISLIAICAVVFFGELAWGNFCEAVFGVKLWDYSKQALHVTQYAGVLSTLGFGLAAYLLFKYVHAPLLKFVQEKISHKVAYWICCTLGVTILLDTLFMLIQMAVFGQAPVYWSISFR